MAKLLVFIACGGVLVLSFMVSRICFYIPFVKHDLDFINQIIIFGLFVFTIFFILTGISYFCLRRGHPMISMMISAFVILVACFSTSYVIQEDLYYPYVIVPALKWEQMQELSSTVQNIAKTSNFKSLAAFLEDPGADMYITSEDAETIKSMIQKAPVNTMKRYHLAEKFITGKRSIIFTDYNIVTSKDTQYHSQIFALIKLKTGENFTDAPFYIRYKDRVFSRIAKVGFQAWLNEINAESPAYKDSCNIDNKMLKSIRASGVTPNSIYSRTLGSLPMACLLSYTSTLESDQKEYARDAKEKAEFEAANNIGIRNDLDHLHKAGIDFTPEEKSDPSLQKFLSSIRANPRQ